MTVVPTPPDPSGVSAVGLTLCNSICVMYYPFFGRLRRPPHSSATILQRLVFPGGRSRARTQRPTPWRRLSSDSVIARAHQSTGGSAGIPHKRRRKKNELISRKPPDLSIDSGRRHTLQLLNESMSLFSCCRHLLFIRAELTGGIRSIRFSSCRVKRGGGGDGSCADWGVVGTFSFCSAAASQADVGKNRWPEMALAADCIDSSVVCTECCYRGCRLQATCELFFI